MCLFCLCACKRERAEREKEGEGRKEERQKGRRLFSGLNEHYLCPYIVLVIVLVKTHSNTVWERKSVCLQIPTSKVI